MIKPKPCRADICKANSFFDGFCRGHLWMSERWVAKQQTKIAEARKRPRKAIPKVSENRKRDNVLYPKLRKEFLRDKRCAVYPDLQATEVHHVRGRVGSYFLDRTFWLPVSRPGHIEIDSKPDWAREKGYIQTRNA